MRIFLSSPIAAHCKRLVAISTADELVDSALLKETNKDALLAIIKAAKRNTPYSNQVQNYLGSLLAKVDTSIEDKVKIAQVLGMFQTVFSARTLGNALVGLEIDAGEYFQQFMTPVQSVSGSGVSEVTLGDVIPKAKREKNDNVIKAIIEGLCESKQPLAITFLREYGKIDSRPHSAVALEKATEIESSLKGCLFFPWLRLLN